MNEVFEKIKQKLEELPFGFMTFGGDMVIGLSDAIEIVDQVAEEYNNGWIPCSERLPSAEETWNYVEEDDVYEPNEFIVMINGATLPTVLFYDSISNEWTDGDDEVYKVIAWQPLPAPPKKEV